MLAQSSPYIADIAPAPSSSRKSFAARLSMSETFNRETIEESNSGKHTSVILANHCAWFVIDKKPRSGDSSSSTDTGATVSSSGSKGETGKSSKDNSVVRLLSSDSPRMDIDEIQLRVGIKMIKHNA